MCSRSCESWRKTTNERTSDAERDQLQHRADRPIHREVVRTSELEEAPKGGRAGVHKRGGASESRKRGAKFNAVWDMRLWWHSPHHQIIPRGFLKNLDGTLPEDFRD